MIFNQWRLFRTMRPASIHSSLHAPREDSLYKANRQPATSSDSLILRTKMTPIDVDTNP